MQQNRSRLIEFLAGEGVTPEMVLSAAEARFAPLFFPRYFRVAGARPSLRYETVLSGESLAALAAVISPESEYPLHGRQGMRKLAGEVPAIAVRRQKNANDLRELQVVIASNALGLQERIRQVIEQEADDMLYVRNAVLLRLDAMCKQAVSSGTVSVTTANNPDGIAFDVPLVPAANRLKANADWRNENTDIVRDLETVRQRALETGAPIAKVLLGESLWYGLINNKSLQSLLKGWFNPGTNARYAVTLEAANAALSANRLPVIEVVPDLAHVQADGKRAPARSWDPDNAAFVPAGALGVIHNALANEQMYPVQGVDYLVSDGVLISRWREQKPLAEVTEGVWCAFPGLEQAANMFVMDTKG